MSVNYEPFKGNAGTVKFSLVKIRENKVPVVPEYLNTILLNVTNYDEKMEESSLNEQYEDINGNARKNHFGYRQVVSFNAVNANNMPIPAGSTKTNRRAIQELVSMITQINTAPKDYILRLVYRGDEYNAVMPSVIYSGVPSLKELSANSNTAQEIPFEFKDVGLSEYSLGLDADDVQTMILEDDGIGGADPVLITTEDEIPFVRQINPYNTTP